VRLLLGFLPAVACIGAMVLCMRMMSGSRSHGKTTTKDGSSNPEGSPGSSDREIADLRDEVNRLRADLRDRQDEPPRPVTP
jgi:hypothetical protein